MTETANAEDVAARLVGLRQTLEGRVWEAATAAARSNDPERIRNLAPLKVDIEAIDVALSHHPVGDAG